MTWKGDLFASHGDGHLTEQDMKVAAVTVRQSLAQVATAAGGGCRSRPEVLWRVLRLSWRAAVPRKVVRVTVRRGRC